MELREYLFRNNMPVSHFARELGVNPTYLRMINRKALIPGHNLAKRIEILTGGQVSYDEMRKNKNK